MNDYAVPQIHNRRRPSGCLIFFSGLTFGAIIREIIGLTSGFLSLHWPDWIDGIARNAWTLIFVFLGCALLFFALVTGFGK